jgi:urease accessory protein
MNLSPEALLGLLQWCDSLFPAGGYAHSFGLEEAVRDGTARDGEGLFEWSRVKMVHSILPGECALLRKAYEAASRRDFEAVGRWDEEGMAMRIPFEFHEGGRAMGKRWIQMAADLYPSPWTKSCLQALQEGRLRGDPAVAFALSGVAAERPLPATLLGYCYGVASGQVSAGLRLLPIGQGEAQRILGRLWKEILKEGLFETAFPNQEEETGPYAFQPAQEIRGMRHESAEMRLFQS